MNVSKKVVLLVVVFTISAIAAYPQEVTAPVSEVSPQVVAEEPIAQTQTSTVQSVQNARQPAAAAPPAVTTQPAAIALPAPVQEENVTRIFQLRVAKALDVVLIARTIFTTSTVIADDRTNSIVFVGTEENCNRFEEILQNLDAKPNRSESLISTNIAYRVFAVEVPVDESNSQKMNHRFQLEMITGQPKSGSSLESLLRNSNFTVEDFDWNKSESQLNISGWTNSPEIIERIAANAGEILGTTVEIKDINYSNAQNTDRVGYPNPFNNTLQEMLNGENYPNNTGKSTPLSTVQKILHNLLGENLRVFGYWFGNTSLPGNCTVPIGSWTLAIDGRRERVEKNQTIRVLSDRDGNEFTMHINLMQADQTILSNTVKASIGRPVVVGYTRRVEGTYIPGALVIIPEKEFSLDEK